MASRAAWWLSVGVTLVMASEARAQAPEADAGVDLQAPLVVADGGVLDPVDPERPDSATAPAEAREPSVSVEVEPGAGLRVRTAVGTFTLWGSVEAFYQWNFSQPSNGLTQYRAFDTRHNALTLGNVVLGAAWEGQRAFARVTLQAGHTPFTYYLGEPALAGSPGAAPTGPQFWQFLQEAVLGYAFDDAKRFRVYGGLFLSPIGPESMNLKDEWHWSRSNLFFGLPFYHAGVVASVAVTDAWTVDVGVVNGWLNVVDNNPEKSVFAEATWASPRGDFSFSALYFGGVERVSGAPEGRGWRHLLDFCATWQATARLALRVELDGGLEPTAFGLAGWAAG